MPRKKKSQEPEEQSKRDEQADQEKATQPEPANPLTLPGDRPNFPIVGIGASAGGFDAAEAFFKNMPPDTGIAFVLIQHLDPTHESILAELVQRLTQMTVYVVEDGMSIEPNCIYVIPPNRNMAFFA